MATAATSLLGLALPVTGELSGTWGDTVNVSITALLDTAVAGTTTLSSDADVTLTTTTLAANQARQAIILWTAGGTVTRTITVPAQSKSYIVINKTSSSQSIKIVGAGPTTGVTIVAGTAAFVVWNGVDFVTASVTSTTGILPVANGGTGLASGTSGGVLAYTASGTLASSAALAASALVIGGGAGAAPSTTTTGTGVVTALGVNTGSAGAFVVNGGALGSPSSVGTMPAFTLGGTVSGGGNQINNVIIGASTPLAGAFTTLSATGLATLASSQITGATFPASGLGLELVFQSGTSLLQSFNRTGSVYLPMSLNGITVDILSSGNTKGSFSSTGLAVTGTLSATGVGTFSSAASVSSGSVMLSNTDPTLRFVVSGGTADKSKYEWRAIAAGPGSDYLQLRKINDANTVFTELLSIANSGQVTIVAGLAGGTSGTGYSFSGSAPAGSLTLDSSGNLLVGASLTTAFFDGKVSSFSATLPGVSGKTSGGATMPAITSWNTETTGDNRFVEFATETIGTSRGSITYNRAGGLVAYNTTSDYRAKDISGPVTGSGALIDSTPVYMGKMKDATQERPMFIAHEVPAYAHTGEKDAVDENGKPVYQQMDASALIPVMWAELQSLRARVAQLESKA